MINKSSISYFNIDHIKNDLKSHSASGAMVTITAQIVRFVLQIGSMAILARLLTPNDFGLIVMVNVVFSFFIIFQDAGLSVATVQSEKINHSQISTLFWINLTLSIVMMLLIAIMAPFIATFYREPRLTGITLALSITFLLSGLSIQQKALLRRQMNFFSLAVIEISSLVAGIAIAITLAALGFNYWALVAMSIAIGLTSTLLSWLIVDWRPGMPTKIMNIRPMLVFGGNLTGTQLLVYFIRDIDKLLIGWVWGAFSLGLYSRASKLAFMPESILLYPISNVVVSAMSRLQNDRPRYRKYYHMALTAITTLGMPIFAFLFIAADDLVHVLLGEQWIGAIPIIRALSVAAFSKTVIGATSWVYISLGLTKRQLHWHIIQTPVTILAILAGLPWGPVGVATSFSISQLLLRFPATVFALRGTPVRIYDVGISIWRPALASISTAAVVAVLMIFVLPHFGPFARLPVTAVLYGSIYFGIWLILPGGHNTLIELFSLARETRLQTKSI